MECLLDFECLLDLDVLPSPSPDPDLADLLPDLDDLLHLPPFPDLLLPSSETLLDLLLPPYEGALQSSGDEGECHPSSPSSSLP